jgi:predicted TIM-barrel fold metal-dependent hydrolase
MTLPEESFLQLQHESPTMRVITLEEHFATPLFLDGPGQDLKKAALKFEGRAIKLIEPLCDIGDKRLAAMDAAGIDFQMLSLTSPGTEQLDAGDAIALARDTNDAVAEAVKKHPKRFGGFAALPTMMPDKAAVELQQRLRSGAFKGAVINGHVRGRYLDDKFFWPILECAEALNAPIHIHPTKPPQPVFDAYYAGFSPLVSDMFGSPGWGWHIETAVHVIRLILGGAFDRFPKLQLVIGHLGEGLMSLFPRLDNMTPAMTKLQRPITSYLRENVYYTVSGFNFPATFLNLLLEVGVPRIMFSADHPYQSMTLARAFLDQLPVSAADRARIAHGNAEKLFGV